MKILSDLTGSTINVSSINNINTFLGFNAGKTTGTNGGNAVSIGNTSNQGTSNIGAYSIAIGSFTKSKAQGTIAIGYNAGSTSGTDNGFGISLGYASNSSNSSIGNNSIAIGRNSESAGDSAIAIGYLAGKTTGSTALYSISIGVESNSKNIGSASIAIGVSGSSAGQSSVSIGNQANSIGNFSTSIGYLSKALNDNNISIGKQAGSTNGTVGTDAISIGTQSNQGTLNIGQNSIAIGNQVLSTNNNSFSIGSFFKNDFKNSFSLGWNNSFKQISDYSLIKSAITTTNATQQSILSYGLFTGTTYSIRAIVTARESISGSSRGMFIIKALAYRENSGAVIEGGSPYQIEKVLSTNAATWDATLNISGNNLIISVTGASSKTINWKVILETTNVS